MPWISWNPVKFCRFHEIQPISVEIWWISGEFQIIQISLLIYCRFHCGFHCGFHLWILWISYKIHLIPCEIPEASEGSHLNHLFLLISGGFQMKSGGFQVKSSGLQVKSALSNKMRFRVIIKYRSFVYKERPKMIEA